jgi:two-component system NarL family response regulator
MVDEGLRIPSKTAAASGTISFEATMTRLIRVCIVAPFEPLRRGLEAAISLAPEMQVFETHATMADLVGGAAYRTADVLVIDVDALNQANLGDTYARLSEWLPALKVLFMGSVQDGQAITFEAIPMLMKLDTVGFVYKEGLAERVIAAIQMIASGASVAEAGVLKRVLTRLSQGASYVPDDKTQLSDREIEVMTMVAHGRTNKEIAQELLVSEGTVKAHISHIMDKLGIERRTELVRYALTTKGLNGEE